MELSPENIANKSDNTDAKNFCNTTSDLEKYPNRLSNAYSAKTSMLTRSFASSMSRLLIIPLFKGALTQTLSLKSRRCYWLLQRHLAKHTPSK